MAFNLPIASYGQSALGGGNGNILQMLMQLIGQASGGRAEAKQANESRYNDILKLFGDNRGRTLDNLDSLSGQEVADANQAYDNKRKNLIADLADRGLSGSTKRIAVESMTQRERDAAVNRIKDTLLQNRNAADLGFTDRATGVMERRTDSYPEPTNISALIGQLAPLLAGGGGGNALAQLLSGSPLASSNGGFGGGPQSMQNNSGQVNSAPAAQVAPGTAVNQRNSAASQPQNSASDEFKRRAALAALHYDDHVGGLSGAAPTQQVLDYMQSMGLANWTPNVGTPQVGFGRVPYEKPDFNPAQYLPSGGTNNGAAPAGYGYATGKNPAYQQRLASYANNRQTYMNSPEYQLSEYMRNQLYPGSRPNPGVNSDGTLAGGGFF